MNDDSRDFRRHLRQTMSLPAVIIWSRLKGRHADTPRFRREHPIGPYFADFYCARAALVIEIDGASHGQGDRPARDDIRDSWMQARGLEVVRIPAADVLHDPDDIVEGMLNLARARIRERRGG